MAKLTIEVHEQQGRTTVVLAGRLISTELAQLQHVFLTTLKKISSDSLPIDMAGVDYIDSLSIGRLIALSEVAKKDGKQLVVVNPHPRTRETLKMLKIDSLIEIR